ncbi:chitobiase/beta-hexosaminidase C-terminal domain-containing protein [Granulicella sp. dw_53]|uniref:chitobiase/beta-hexosaminidase C-terminal domain-containing protein n=1 Tax=Granulicella sp. dw_53 TaxID=2719792 RepID=UPI001BD601BB|nr:chitobiase/beta-hexosaminidase C-terminal domain-containing protein [Granulicella sp. dw_53]
MQVLRRIVSRQVVLAMTLVGVLTMVGCSGDSSSSGPNVTATPTFNPGAGSYNTSQTVTISDSTPGAVLYCTTDGTTPTTSSPQCSQPTTVFKTEFLQAIAAAPGKTSSTVASAGYTINLNAAATPTFSPAGGSYTSAQTVTISDATAGANIYFTTDGSVPTATSTLYTAPLTISKSMTLSAIAIASGFANSGIASASYLVGTGTAAPVISPAGGTFGAAQNVTITDATSGANIYYTVDGSVPTSSSTPYSGPINVSANQTISTIAIASGTASVVTTASFTITIPAAAPPTFSPAGGTYSTAQNVILSDTTPGATIYYAVDGSTPTTSSTKYDNTSIAVGGSETIKAIATATGFGSSAVASATYTLNLSVATPTFSPAAGTFSAAQTVTINDATAGATIYYTIDGSAPSTSSTKYTGTAIAVASTETLNAVAAVGNTLSSVATATYTINIPSTFSGNVLSGTLPVNGAQVVLYAAGQSDYASSADTLSTTAVTTDASGAFAFSYNCPASPGDLVYVVATGGSTGSGGANPSLALMAALGPCGSIPPTTKVVVNEVTTVASAYALSQFMTGAANVGAAATTASYHGLANAFKTVRNLVDLTTGQALDHTPAYPTNLTGDPNILNNSTVPQSRINTLANTLNSCATAGGACSTLFQAATPSSGSAPADTLQAILNIAQHPGNQAGMVFNVAAGSGPFTPALTAAPNDWTLALTYTGGGLGFAPGIQIPFATGRNTSGQFLNTAMAIDATGNIWVTGFNNNSVNSTIDPDQFSGMIAEFSNQGTPLTQPSQFASGTPSAATFGGYIPIKQFTGNGINNGGTQVPQSIALDPSGNAWVLGGSGSAGGGSATTSSGGALTEIGPGLSVVLPYVNLGSASAYSSIAIDGGSNVWAFGSNGLQEFDSSGKLALGPDSGVNNPASPFGYGALPALIFDSNGTSLWASDNSCCGDLYQINPKNDTAIVDYFANAPGTYTPLVAGSADAATGNPGNIYGCGDANTTGPILDVFNISNPTSPVAAYPISARGCGNQMVMDGAGHIFTVTGSPDTTAITPGIVDEFAVSSSGVTQISPSTGYTGTGTGESPTINPDRNASLILQNGLSVPAAGVTGAAIDGSGNLWVLNVDTGSTASPGNALVEFVGIAAPVVTPTSLALQFGQVGVRP